MDKQFANNLRNVRIKAGLTQAQVAEKIGIAPSSYSCYESGKREPDVPKLKKIADVLGVTGNELLGIDEDGSEFPPQFNAELSNYEERLLQKFRALSEGRKKIVETTIDMLYAEVK